MDVSPVSALSAIIDGGKRRAPIDQLESPAAQGAIDFCAAHGSAWGGPRHAGRMQRKMPIQKILAFCPRPARLLFGVDTPQQDERQPSSGVTSIQEPSAGKLSDCPVTGISSRRRAAHGRQPKRIDTPLNNRRPI